MAQAVAALILVLAIPRLVDAAGKLDTSAFNTYYAAQSRKLHGHMANVVAAYSDLARRGAVGPMKDVLAVRGALSACWELFLNAGDMVYMYDRIDPLCEKTVKEVGELMRSGLSVVAGKLEKELQWFAISAKNLEGQPISGELAAAEKDFRDAATAFRTFAVEFAKPVVAQPGGTGQGAQAGQPALLGPTSPRVAAPAPVFPGGTPGKGLPNGRP
ncbi:hypothetical protein [Desulfolutivibrio sulfoxidireducens]|uniref:hypothetical protein n=1 Tax=Desulfolutivibrio sulfoxidireducens TaxID=2773299 RepID=UPI00159CFEB3|nr:hypothetical protein [Desulfolutivibrio sulfoxidireducens]QLA16427.1 hypothetical protein GD605_10005 [Desulfolutivibrio sulfoxidireducens]QLA19692.1 hypothetical protein GD604_08055 [Desulfolutivibrio sulfoxidireducens]